MKKLQEIVFSKIKLEGISEEPFISRTQKEYNYNFLEKELTKYENLMILKDFLNQLTITIANFI